MFLLNWYRELLELKREYKQPRPCESCEVLKISVEQLRADNQRLLDRMLEKPEPEVRPATDNVTPIIPRGRQMPWRVRQQMLEENDRHQAKLMRDAPRPSPVIATPADTTTEQLEDEVLEKELNNAGQEREAQARK